MSNRSEVGERSSDVRLMRLYLYCMSSLSGRITSTGILKSNVRTISNEEPQRLLIEDTIRYN